MLLGWANWGLEKLHYLSRAAQVVSVRARTETLPLILLQQATFKEGKGNIDEIVSFPVFLLNNIVLFLKWCKVRWNLGLIQFSFLLIMVELDLNITSNSFSVFERMLECQSWSYAAESLVPETIACQSSLPPHRRPLRVYRQSPWSSGNKAATRVFVTSEEGAILTRCLPRLILTMLKGIFTSTSGCNKWVVSSSEPENRTKKIKSWFFIGERQK